MVTKMVPRIENTILKVTTKLKGWPKIALKIDQSIKKHEMVCSPNCSPNCQGQQMTNI